MRPDLDAIEERLKPGNILPFDLGTTQYLVETISELLAYIRGLERRLDEAEARLQAARDWKDGPVGCPLCRHEESAYGSQMVEECGLHRKMDDLAQDLAIERQIAHANESMVRDISEIIGADEDDNPVGVARARMEEIASYEEALAEAEAQREVAEAARKVEEWVPRRKVRMLDDPPEDARPPETVPAKGMDTFTGYAAIFNEPDEHGNVIRPGAFRKSLAKRQPAMLWEHRRKQPIGVWLDLTEDEVGLKVKGRIITETKRGAEIWALVRACAITGLSIGYGAIEFEENEKGWAAISEHGGRIATAIDLWEISLVSTPSSPQARITKVYFAAEDAP